ncbi:hypothetical protein D3C78_1129780 [compost metagenome]
MLVLLLRRLNAGHEERIKRPHIIVAELGIGWVRHSRIQPVPVSRDSAAYCAIKVGQAVITDARLFVRGNVGGID